MEVFERLLQIRKEAGLKQDEFGKRIGVTRAAICNYETGKRSMSDTIILAVCREFGVNKEWLQTGDGDMYIHTNHMDALRQQYNLSQEEVDVVEKFLSFPPDGRKYIIDFMKSVTGKVQAPVAPKPASEMTVDEMAEVVHPHPTVSEAIMEAALIASGHPVHI